MDMTRTKSDKQTDIGKDMIIGMRFIHLGDLHIGKLLFDYSLIDDQRYMLERIVELAVERKVDAFLIAGDVYDRPIPSEEAVRLFNDFICSISKHEIKTYIISGNHDSDERLNFVSELLEKSGVFIASKFDGSLRCTEFTDEFGTVRVYMMPFVKASQVKHYYEEAEINDYNDAVRTVIDNASIDEAGRNILIAHQFVAGKGSDPQISGSESVAVQSVGLVEKVGADNFDAFDYVALGHIHSPQKIGREEVRYSGSLLKYSLSEINDAKTFPIVTLSEKGKVDIELVELKPLREVRHIKGELRKLLDKKNLCESDDYMYVTLTDEDVINDAMGVIRQFYPRTVKLDYDNSHTHEIDDIDIAKIADARSFSELFRDFYSQMYQCEITDEEMKLINEIAGKAGITDETY